MKAHIPSRHVRIPSDADTLRTQQNEIQERLKPLLDLAENSDYLIAGSVGEFIAGEELLQIPRFAFIGPRGGGDTIRLGIFAAIFGDEAEGAEAVIEFLQRLEKKPRLATGYHVYVYPICNPTGLIARTHHNCAGEDLSKHFWRGSSQPEIYYLERELGVLRFHGVVSIHAKKHLNTFVLRANSEILTRDVIHPVIESSQELVPVSASTARSDADFLTVGDELDPRPFELHLGIPGNAPDRSRVNGTIHLLNSVLDSYRSFLSISQHL